MSEPLPKSGFRFLKSDEIRSFDMVDVSKWDVMGEFGYFFIADISVPSAIHDLTSDYRMYQK